MDAEPPARRQIQFIPHRTILLARSFPWRRRTPSLKVAVIAESRNRIDPASIDCQQLVQAGPPRRRSEGKVAPGQRSKGACKKCRRYA